MTDKSALALLPPGWTGGAPDADALAKTFGLEVLATLPPADELRMNAKNQATTLFDLAPREALSQALKKLGERLVLRSQVPEQATSKSGTWLNLNRLWGAK